MLNKFLFKIAKGSFIGKMTGIVFQYGSWAIPVKKIYSSKEIIAFHHPQPSYENHIIISPKRAVKNLQQMALDRFSKYFVKVWEAVKDICTACPKYTDSFVIVANGGKRQEIQQVHFHMFTNHEIVNEYTAQGQAENIFYSDRDVCVLEHPNPNWEFHFVITPISSSETAGKEEYSYFRSVLHCIDRLNVKFHIVQRGYSLVYQYNKQKNEKELPIFHIIAGEKWNSSIRAFLQRSF